jgi:hypothetical protein
MPKKIEGGSDNWRTPQDLWNTLNAQYGFTIDLCASKQDAKTEKYISSLEIDLVPPDSIAWINPPFSKVKQLLPIVLKDNYPVVGIYRADNFETKIWQEHILQKADWLFFFSGRIRYEDPFGTRQSPMFPSVLWGKRLPEPIGLQGVCVRVR